MATLLHSDSRRLYSWWWDSHISPKNSKWLQENLTDMDSKVKAMIKLIEEDADSFARRAEMYYKKRPELMKMVEEFYRAYRALAERYDHATGALRQAQRTMSEAFPNQIPLVLPDESPSGSSGSDLEPHTPELPAPSRALYDPDELQKDALGVSSSFHVIKRNGVYSEENDVLRRKGLKQLNEMFATGEGEAHAGLHEGRVRKGLHFHEEEGKGSEYRTHDWSMDLHNQDSKGKEDVQNEIKRLREAVTQLSTENQNLKSQKISESVRADKAESDVQNLKDSLCKFNFVVNHAIQEYQHSVESISFMETRIYRAQDEVKKLHDVIVMEAVKLSSAENRSFLLEKANQSLQLELDAQEQKIKNLQEENSQLSTENQNLKSQITSDSERANRAESEVQSVQDSLSKLKFDKEAAILQYQQSLDRLSDLNIQLSRTQNDFKKLSDEMVMEATKLSSSQERCLLSEKGKQSLQLELDILEQRLKAQQEEHNQLSTENENLKRHVTTESYRAEKAETEVQSVKYSLSKLNSEKEAAVLQYQQSLERISYMETQISQIQDDHKKLCVEMVMEATKLSSAEERSLLLEKANRSLQMEFDILEGKIKAQQEEHKKFSTENESLKSQITTESERAEKAETEVQSVQCNLSKLNFEKEAAIIQYQQSLERISYLETQISCTEDDLKKLSNEMVMNATKLSSAEEECLLLEKANQSIQLELDIVELKIRAHQEECFQLSTMNENLKRQIKSESEHADKAETEIQILKDCLNKLNFENESFILQYQQSLVRISYLETQISRVQDDFKMLNNEMIMETVKSRFAEDRYLLLEKAYQSIQLEVDTLEKKQKTTEEEVAYQQLELETFKTSLQDERQCRMEAQMALLSMEKLHSQSQEELKLLGLEIHYIADKLKDVELSNMGLEEEICNLTDENSTLSKQNMSSVLKIKDLQDEIDILKEIKRKLEDETRLYLEENKVLLHEFDMLKEDKNELEQRHQNLTADMEAVRLNAESLHASLKELQDEQVELNKVCKKHEEEKLLLLENMGSMEKISERNRVMENSLVDVNVELEELREKIKTLGYSCEPLHGEVSTNITENTVLISQVETIAQNKEKLIGKNDFLEKSVSVTNLEVEGLKGKLREIEESFQSLYAQKKNLISERNTLASQVNIISQRLESAESRHAELEVKHVNLEREKDMRAHQALELDSLLKLEKKEHETRIQSSKNQLATLENQILVLQEENQVREEEVEVEQKKGMSTLIELFILHSCLRDMKSMILVLAKDSQKHLDTSRCAEKLVSQLQQEDLIQMEKIASLSEHNEKVKEGILMLLRALNINMDCGSKDRAQDEVLLEIILGEIRNLLTSISGAQDETQLLQLEMSVIFTLLKHLGLHVEDLRMEKQLLEQILEIREDEILVLQCNRQELLERNEQLVQDVQISGNREEEMKSVMGALQWQLSDLHGAQQTSQTEIHKLLDENQSLSKKLYSLREEKEALEEENHAVLAEALTLEHLYLLFRSFNAEKAMELKLFSDDAYRLCQDNNNLDQEIRQMNEKLSVLEMENLQLKGLVACLEEYRNRLLTLQFDLNTSKYFYEELTNQIETGIKLFIQKEMELAETNQKIQSTQKNNEELSRHLECLIEEIYRNKVMREELQNKIFSLSEGIACRDKEIAQIGEANKLLFGKLENLNSEVGALRSREEQLTFRLQKGIDEVDRCEVEIMTLSKDLHISTVGAAIFEEKGFELILGFESLEICALIQRVVLNEEITSRNVYVRELKGKLNDLEGENRRLKSHFKAYMPRVMPLQDSIASLEQQALFLEEHPVSNKQDNPLVSHQQHVEGSLSEYPTTMMPTGVQELQQLTPKVEEHRKVIINTAVLLEKERFDSDVTSDAARKETEEIKVKRRSGLEEGKISNGIIMQMEGGEESGTDHILQKDDCETSKMKHMQMTKDIQLDQVSSSPYESNVGSYGLTRMETSETDDQMLELWEAAERDCYSQMQMPPPVNLEHDIEAVEEEKSEYPSSELVAEKELSVDRLEVSSELWESHEEWSRKVIERLTSDAQRLSVLQTSMKELERKMENSEKSKLPKSLEYDTIKANLKEAQGAILELIDININLTKKAEYFPASCSGSGTSGAQEETERKGRRQISEHARRGSEKIGRLELELQKIQYVLLKLEEEHNDDRTKAADRRPKIVLRDYLHGRRNGARQKKGAFCGCMRPKTNDD